MNEQTLPLRLAQDRFGALVVAPLYQERRPAGGGPAPILGRSGPGELDVGGQRLVGLAVAGEIDRIAIGLGGGIERLRRLGGQRVDVGLGALDGLAGRRPRPRGHRQARGGAHHIAGDAGLMAEPLAQVAVQFAEGDAGLGNLHLDVVAPVLGIGRGRSGGHGLGLQLRQPVEHASGHHLAGQAALGEVGRHGEGRDGQAMVLVRLPGHDGHRRCNRQADDRGHHLQQGLHPVAEAAPAQAGGLQLPLLVQVFGLEVDQSGLLQEESCGFGWQLGSWPSLAQRQGHRRRTGLIERLLGRGFGLFASLSHVVGRRSQPCRARPPLLRRP